ncbi:sensor histidine kinase CssS [Clostridium homopropionicum DSM 5847]|uniref:histidine kinase n=1 Tax=Clostridium homopropionicum DSM 5847 TaxID=1121318 RepID=A0A0L6Z6Y9_9CLOT|nr:ATP-binding protein [Clostridium homopropionicum]KOA18724.1 sensor histidine kinase CssS [Clostridium homopropionicum DSM 5847]SFG53950.1 two-component system, OmpR family, sensor histidine kinase CssS [Clostridium homopropionicum]
MKNRKNKPLALQIWLVFTSVILVIFILLSLYFTLAIKRFFTEETYKTIETAQKNIILKNTNKSISTEDNSVTGENNDIREVKHIKLSYNNNAADLQKIEKIIPNETTAELFLKKLENQVKNQTDITKRYIQRTNSGRILYVVTINRNNKKGTFLVSYMWDTYRNSLSTALMRKLFSVMIIALILSIIAAKYLSQKLVTSLKELESKVRKIGKKQWHESININSNDEIGELSKSIEEMRKELVKQDEYEQTMLQQASHDLKTPLMVIRSYVQAVEDGIYPKGDLKNTMNVIDSEAERMQKRIKNLLYLTKLRYMSKHKNESKKFHIKNLIEEIVDSFSYNEKNIQFEVNIDDLIVYGDEEQWTVVLENLIDNELRYAKTLIRIKAYEDNSYQYIIIYNDGEKIPDDKLHSIFGTFHKDKGGSFGLGLDIVKRIVTMYNGTIKAENQNIGVSFIITLNKV